MKYLLLIIAHFLGDFMFQSSTMASKKISSLKYFGLHCLIYSGFTGLTLIWFKPLKNVVYAALIIIISHIVIDYFRNTILNKLSKKQRNHKNLDFVIIIADQILHLLIIIFSVHLLKSPNDSGKIILNIILTYLSWNHLYNFTVLAFLYILCLSPTAIFIKKVFILFSFQNEDNPKIKDDLIKSGYLIGVLERIIILNLGLNGQLGAIGFVIAAKSLARFNQLNDKTFAEKYLVGTLLSVAIALFCISIGKFLLIT